MPAYYGSFCSCYSCRHNYISTQQAQAGIYPDWGPRQPDKTAAGIQLCQNGLRAKPQLGIKICFGRKASRCFVATYKLTEPQIESHGACWPDIDQRNDNTASGRTRSCTYLNQQLQQTLWCHVYVLAAFSLIYSCVSPCAQLSHTGPSKQRSKREAAADGSAQLYPETQQSITVLSPRKETHLLVSEKGFAAADSRRKKKKQALWWFKLRLVSMKKTSCFTLRCELPHHFFKDCAKQTARCVTFTCPLLNMTKEAKVTVRSRLWNSTMLEVSSAALNA